MARWEDAKKAAMQVLGPKGKIPEWSKTLSKAIEESTEAWQAFKAARTSLKDALDVQDKKFDKYLAALRADVDALNKDSLGLDPKNKEDAQKIAAARKPLMKYANSALHEGEGATKDLKKLSTVVKSVMSSPAPPGHDV
jgi:hypothetical protein